MNESTIITLASGSHGDVNLMIFIFGTLVACCVIGVVLAVTNKLEDEWDSNRSYQKKEGK